MAETPGAGDQTQLSPLSDTGEGGNVTLTPGGGGGGSTAKFGKGVFSKDTGLYERFRFTPKHNDPFQEKMGAGHRMARIFLPSGMKSVVESVVASNGGNVSQSGGDPLSSLTSDDGYFDFMVTSVDESFDDRYQVMETLGDNYALFGLGKKPSVFNFSGVLLNTVENDWRVAFIYMYQQYISISQLAKFRDGNFRNFMTIRYDSMFAQGALLGLRTSIRAENEMVTPFSFTMLVTRLTWVNLDTVSLQDTQKAIVNGDTVPPSAYNMTFIAASSLGATVALKKTEVANVPDPKKVKQTPKKSSKATAATKP